MLCCEWQIFEVVCVFLLKNLIFSLQVFVLGIGPLNVVIAGVFYSTRIGMLGFVERAEKICTLD